MTYPINYASVGPRRSGGLIAFGVVSIVIGAISGCMAALMPLSLVAMQFAPSSAAPGVPRQWATILSATVLYALAAGAFIWIGVDSCRHRRWVRPVVLGLMWPWLVIGILSSIVWIVMLPQMASSMAASMPPTAAGPTLPRGMVTLMVAITSMMMFFMYIVIPGSFVWFYQRRSLQAVLDENDRGLAWTDAVPTQVLGLSLWLGLSAMFALIMLMRTAMPFFGTVLTGLPAVAAILVTAAALIFAAYSSYRLRIGGWWIALAVAVLTPISMGITLMRLGIVDMYRAAGYSEAELEQMGKLGINNRMLMLSAILLFGLPGVAYLIYVRRFFSRSTRVLEARPLQADVTP